jgi:tetratricopeptide (TPR) repeat protein
MEIRQEAERMVKQLEEAERILLDAARRKEYDLQLQTAPPPTGRVDESVIHEGVDLVQEGWRLLIAGNIAEAIYVATQATQRDSSNPEAWALLGQAKYRWGEIEDAIYEYKRAINLRPNEASYYFDLGCVYESTERWSEALQQFQRAVQIDPSVPMYRAGIGILLIKNEKYQEGIEILERCVKEEPDNNSYQLYLAIAYVESAYQRWTYVPEGSHVPPGYYATHLEQVREAQACLDKAEQLKVTDSELEAHIRKVRANIDSMLERKFHGNWMAPIIAVVVGIIVLSQAKTGDILLGLLILASGILYFPASLTPQYIVNRRVIAGKVDAASSFLGYLAGENVGCLWMFIGGILLAIFTPVLTAWNFYKNYLAEGFSSPKEASQNKTLIIAVGGGALVVVLGLVIALSQSGKKAPSTPLMAKSASSANPSLPKNKAATQKTPPTQYPEPVVPGITPEFSRKWRVEWKGGRTNALYTGSLFINNKLDDKTYTGSMRVNTPQGQVVSQNAIVYIKKSKVEIRCSNPSNPRYPADNFFLDLSGNTMTGYDRDVKNNLGYGVVFTAIK